MQPLTQHSLYKNGRRKWPWIARMWGIAMEFLFPAFCFQCRREGSFLCEQCFAGLEREPLQEKRESAEGLDELLACCWYNEGSLLAKLIHAFKYEFVRGLGGPLGLLLKEVLAQRLVAKRVVVCAVPLHRRRLRWRGFNQAELLGRQVALALQVAMVPLLERRRFSKPQKELARQERLRNVEGAFVVRRSAERVLKKDVTVVLVDDVATTLATLEACAKALKQAGAHRVVAIVLARVP